jgi:hypothetical protein
MKYVVDEEYNGLLVNVAATRLKSFFIWAANKNLNRSKASMLLPSDLRASQSL